jgi:DNA-directed RNA polymerase specialized sigma24 family protein
VPGAVGAPGVATGTDAAPALAVVDPTDRPGGDLPTVAAGRGVGDLVSGDGGIAAVADRLDVDAALGRLPVDFRAAVVLRDLCDLDYAEIARVLHIPVGTVRSRIARGRAQLADLVGNPGGPADRPTTSP